MSHVAQIGWVTTTFALFAVIGLVRLGGVRWRLTSQLLFVFDYRQRLSQLMQTRDRDTYELLTLDATKMQAQLGAEGVLSFRPPFANYIVPHYPVVVNALAELRKCFSDELLSRGDLAAQYHALIEDALLRHEGTVRERVRRNTRSLANPLKWLLTGVEWVLSVPVWVLESFGLVSKTSSTRFKASATFRVASGLTALMGFCSAVVGLVTGWEPFLMIARRLPYAF
jgi:hypothetical protein